MTYWNARAEFERQYWRELLVRTQQNVSQAAREACVSRTHLYRLLQRVGTGFRARGYHKE